MNTVMNRIGLYANNIEECNRIIRKYKNVLEVTEIFTYLCVAYCDLIEFTYR